MNESSEAVKAASVVAASLAPFGCIYGCCSALLILIGGGVIGLIVAHLLRLH